MANINIADLTVFQGDGCDHIRRAFKQYTRIVNLWNEMCAGEKYPENVVEISKQVGVLMSIIRRYFPAPVSPSSYMGFKIHDCNTEEIQACGMIFGIKRNLSETGDTYITYMTKEEKYQYISSMWNIPPTMLETVIPIAIMRDLMADKKLSLSIPDCVVKVNGKDFNGVKWFVETYGLLILVS
jgi:hypothetical protein